jgi:tetratricopeptide (TPR) repeat protein
MPKYSRKTYTYGAIFLIVFIGIIAGFAVWLITNSSRVNYERGVKFYEAGQYQEALMFLESSIQFLGTRNAESAYLMGKILTEAYNEPNMAREYLNKGLKFSEEPKLKAKIYQTYAQLMKTLDMSDSASYYQKKARELNSPAP